MPQVISASFLKAKRIDTVVTIMCTLSFIVSTSEQGVRQCASQPQDWPRWGSAAGHLQQRGRPGLIALAAVLIRRHRGLKYETYRGQLDGTLRRHNQCNTPHPMK